MAGAVDLAALKEYAEKTKPTVVLDTNIIIRCEKASHFLTDTCALLDIRICDTVYWEFLRNVNLERFRQRRTFLATWHRSDFLKEDMILHEDANVAEMHSRLFVLLLHFYPSAPQAVLDFLSPDLWIAAAAVAYRFDHVLTENQKDFPSALFETVLTIGNADQAVHLLRFRRAEIRETWIALTDAPVIEVTIDSLL